MKAQIVSKGRTLSEVLIAVFLSFTVLAVFVPLSPSQPAGGLDPSWMFAMNQAVAQGLVFGKDMVFTFGPYASIYTKSYHPATDHLMVFGGLYLGICYALALLLLVRTSRLRWLIVFGGFLAALMHSRDALLFSYPLLLAITVYRIALPDSEIKSSKKLLLIFGLLFTPLGLLPLIKGSFLLICLAAIILCFCLFWFRNSKALAFGSLLLPFAAMVVFWLISRQPISGLPYFFANLLPIISGYTEAMAWHGNTREIIFYLVASMAMLYVIAVVKEVPVVAKLFLLFSFAAFLFVAFKGGFVRHDGHAVMAGTSLVIAAIMLCLVVQHKHASVALLLSVFACAYIDKGYIGSSTKMVFENITNTYSAFFNGLRTRASGQDRLAEAFNQRIGSISKESPIPLMKGTTDIYSHGQAELIASGNKWSPRPIPQSYSVYTTSLARLNEAHLTSDAAPDNVIFKVEPIDERLPSLEDGLSWPTLINNYSPDKLQNDFLYLKKKATPYTTSQGVDISNGTATLGQDVTLPHQSGPIFAEVDIHQTFIGRLISFLYKPKQLKVMIELADGTRKQYRMVSVMAKSGFLISPLIENTSEFALLFGDRSYLNDKLVKSIRIEPEAGGSIFWRSEYTVKLSKLELQADTDVFSLITFDPIDERTPKAGGKSSAANCEGSIDYVNGSSPPPPSIKASHILSVAGWQAVSAKDGVVPDAIFVTLTDKQGKKAYIKARTAPRPDVKEYFKQPHMSDPGFKAYINLTGFKGDFAIGLSRLHRGKLESCQQFNMPLSISR